MKKPLLLRFIFIGFPLCGYLTTNFLPLLMYTLPL